ncbi:peroxidase family protein [Gordonia sp. ABSL11-1]|uniref:peroxidase family protein n=1 Tax=Gordonia sp. ABSL11-1 TaxID=3053924 RepID=UPI002572DBB9|nr:peroxidase family protein [Gordonia sp. ABSL11-1]MDL9946188.1 peroxidase family protein [Gordonia sp. ABSL11-1]
MFAVIRSITGLIADNPTDREVSSRRRIARVLARGSETVDRRRGWHTLPVPVGLAVLVGLRSRMRELNLFDAGPHPADVDGPPPPPAPTRARTIEGTFNAVASPRMGAEGALFGRNIPLDDTAPETGSTLLTPSPRTISNELLARTTFRPATSLNLLAAAWIQFEVHDWMSHFDADDAIEIATEPDDPWPSDRMSVPRTRSCPGSAGAAPTYPNRDTHWWDASQIYGATQEQATAIRSFQGGEITILDDGLPPPAAESGLERTGPAGNFWLGLGLLHSLFLAEHNSICRRLHSAYPAMDDQQLYDTARLVNTALMAKIHTVDWTPAIIAHPTTVAAMRGNWYGLLGERVAKRSGRLFESEVLSGIPGSTTEFHGVPYSLTEEFVAVYRMHPLLPDEVTIRRADTDRELATHGLDELLTDAVPDARVRRLLSEYAMPDLLYSFGRAHPGTLDLHNFPDALRTLRRLDGSLMDLATVDVLRSRERGVPRYNAFRQAFRLPAATSFMDLTHDRGLADDLATVYRDVDDVDLMVGLYAEPKPAGFGFSDTAFRVFILMASRRISGDRFLTTDFRPEIYTEVGMSWVRDNSMRSVLLRHFPTLAPTLGRVANPFAPWPAP